MPFDADTSRTIAGRSALFDGVRRDVVKRTVAKLALREVAPGEKVLAEGAKRTELRDLDLYILVAGQLAASRTMSDGRVQQLSTMSPGDFFGELARADDGVRSATVTAVTPAVVGRLPASVVDELVEEAPVVMRTIAATLARRLRAADAERLSVRHGGEQDHPA
jgi:CRP-like cAMP-binding protein